MFQQIYKILPNFDSNPLICDPTLLPGTNSPSIANSNRVFPGSLDLTYLDIPNPATAYLFLFWPSSGKNGWSKLD